MRRLFWIGLGSGLGSGLRHALDTVGCLLEFGYFPFATLLINVSGSLLIGCFAGLRAGAEARLQNSSVWDFWITGFCGGFTTFSAFSWQTLALIHDGQAPLAAFYTAGSVGLGLIAFALGWTAANKSRM